MFKITLPEQREKTYMFGDVTIDVTWSLASPEMADQQGPEWICPA